MKRRDHRRGAVVPVHLEQLRGAERVAEYSKHRDRHVQMQRPGYLRGRDAPLSLSPPLGVPRYDRYVAVELLALERELERFVASAKALERDVDVPRVRRDCRDEPGALLPRRNGRNGRLGVERGCDGVDDPRREVVRDGLRAREKGRGVVGQRLSVGWVRGRFAVR